MKTLRIITVIASLFVMPPMANAQSVNTTTNTVVVDATAEKECAQAQVLLNRLHEINDLDKTTLSVTEKRKLRGEVKNIHQSLKELSGGVYISVGALIIILLLLIILL